MPFPADHIANIAILMPVYNDWTGCAQLLRMLDHVLAREGYFVAVYLVDDGSWPKPDRDFLGCGNYAAIETIEILRLKRNLGHQRAICIGLAHIEANTSHEKVLLLDSDGEDRAADAVRLLAKSNECADRIVFAGRTK